MVVRQHANPGVLLALQDPIHKAFSSCVTLSSLLSIATVVLVWYQDKDVIA